MTPIIKNNRKHRFLQYLQEHPNKWISANEVANYLHVSTRQIRNYVNEINDYCKDDVIILSSNKGYTLHVDSTVFLVEQTTIHETPETRHYYIIQKIVSSILGYDIFDFSDELFVSISTIEMDLKHIRNIVEKFNLRLTRNKNLILLHGDEMRKRKLMNHLLSNNAQNIMKIEKLQQLALQFQSRDIQKDLKEIFSNNSIYANDFTLKNTALHLIITMDRISNQYILQDDVNLVPLYETVQYRVAKNISEYLYSNFSILMNDAELYNLIMLISNNTTLLDYSFIDASNVEFFIEDKYIKITKEVMLKVETYYQLDPFDDDFLVKLAIHTKNLFSRMNNHYYAKNPLTRKIKTSYPLIYDIAVFIAQEFKTNYKISLNDDEIAFIAFHVGSYFESSAKKLNKLTCVFIYEDYYSIHEALLFKISRLFEDHIIINDAISINSYCPKQIHSDFVISTVDEPFEIPSAIIHPFLLEKDITNITNTVQRLKNKKRTTSLKEKLLIFFDEKIFYRNLELNDATSIIKKLTHDVIDLNYAKSEFQDDVLLREKMSSTAYGEVAVPHALSQSVNRSFISIVLNEKKANWNTSDVHIILLIGIHKDNRGFFSEIFDDLIDLISEPQHISTLLQCTSFDEFIETITTIV